MRVSAVRFGRTVSKNYQSQKAEVEITLAEGEDKDVAMDRARLLVDQALGLVPSDGEIRAAAEGAAALVKVLDALVDK